MTEISGGDGMSQQLRAFPGVHLIPDGEITLSVLTRSSGILKKNEKADFGILVQGMSQPIILNF